MGLGGGLLRLLVRLGLGQHQFHRIAIGLVEAQLRQACREMLGQVGAHVDQVAVRMVDHQPAGVEVHLAADAARKERIGPAVLAVADDRVADRRHVDAQLVGPPGQRLQLDPAGTVPGAVDHAIAAARGLAFARLVDHHLFAAGARLLGQRQVDHPVADLRHADHQRPIDLARGTARKALGKERRAARSAGDQQDARGILVEPVDQPWARAVLRIGIEQPVDMGIGPAAALGGKARRLVEHDRGAVLGNDHAFGQRQLLRGQRLPGPRLLFGAFAAGGNAQHLARAQPVGHIGAFAVHPDLPGPGPAADRGKADLRQVPLEPAIEPDPVIVGRNGELADAVGRNGAPRGHARVLARASPPTSPATPPASETAA